MPGISKARSDGLYPVIRYDGFTFPPALKTNLVPKAIYSPSGRTLARIEMTLQVSCIISSIDFSTTGETYAQDNSANLKDWFSDDVEVNSLNPELDAALTYLIMKLSRPGKKLEVSNLGFGDYVIDNNLGLYTGGSGSQAHVKDIANGPQARFISIEKFINASTASVVWEVIFSVHPCLITRKGVNLGEFPISHPPILACDYSISTSIASYGTFTRTITGILLLGNYVEPQFKETFYIPDGTRSSYGIVRQISDAFPLLPTCTRELTYDVSQDRLELRFTIVDAQIPTDDPYFPGCSSMNVQISVRSLTALDSATLNGTSLTKSPSTNCAEVQAQVSISGTVEIFKSFPKATAFNAFVNICSTYFAKNPAVQDPGYLVQNFGVTNHIYSREASFFVTYLILSPLDMLIQKTLVFSKEAEENVDRGWENWNSSRVANNTGYGFDGDKNLDPDSRNDKVVDACNLDKLPKFTVGNPGTTNSPT